MVGYAEDGFCTNRPHTGAGSRGSGAARRRGGAGIRPGRHGRLGGTSTGTTRDFRHGAATAATGLYGVSRVLSFLGEAVGGLLPVLLGLAATRSEEHTSELQSP